MVPNVMLRGRTGHPLLEELKKWRYAHRGYHDKPTVPENSLPAFKRAVERGWGAEFDVHLLRDGTLAVFHDSDIARCTGETGILEDLDMAALSRLTLEGTQEKVPLFDEVLSVFEGKAPVIIELKSYRDDHAALAEAVCQRLDSYKGVFCVESFDPRVVADIRKLRPQYVRGQLVLNFRQEKGSLTRIQQAVFSDLAYNILTRPDFIACKYEHHQMRSVRRAVDRLGLTEVNWTIRSKKDLADAEARGAIPIFEKFDPDN
jgi:glycerophosphoryl diester phosphodiesterase